MDLNLHLYLFADRELNDIMKIVDIYNMHLFFSDHSVISKMILHAWQGNNQNQRFFEASYTNVL